MDLSAMTSTEGNKEDSSTSIDQPRSRKYVALDGDRIKIYENQRDLTDEDDYDRSEQ
jgi:hypothetical protein